MYKIIIFAIIATIAVTMIGLGTLVENQAFAGHGNTSQHNTINAGNGGGSNQGNHLTCVNGVCT